MSLVISEIKLYELLKAKIGEKEAEAFVQILENKVDKKFEDKVTLLSTKQDVAKLETRMAETKVDLIKWMIGIAIAACGTLVALMKFFLHS